MGNNNNIKKFSFNFFYEKYLSNVVINIIKFKYIMLIKKRPLYINLLLIKINITIMKKKSIKKIASVLQIYYVRIINTN